MKNSFRQKMILALILDVLIHLLVFKPMAQRINTLGLEGLSWWNRWAFELLFRADHYPVMALDPAIVLFGESPFALFVAPYLVMLALVVWGRHLWKFIQFILRTAHKIANFGIVIILGWLKPTLAFSSSLMLEHMKWLYNRIRAMLGYPIESDTSKGSSRFSTKREIKKLLHKRHTGLLIDGVNRIKRSLSVCHLAVIAPSGRGKTTNYVIPNVLGLPEFMNPETKLPSSMVITDPKGEIYDLTSQYLQDQGYKVKLLEVNKPNHSEHFNPLKRANTDTELAKVAQIIVESGLSDSKNNDFWGSSAKLLLTTILRIIKRSNIPEKQQNLANVKRFVDLMGGDGKAMIDFVGNYCTDAGAITEYISFVQHNAETFSNILLTLKTVLKDLAVAEICQLTQDDTLDFESLRTEKTVLYIITPFSDIEFYRFILTILYTQIFNFCDTVGNGNDILFMLDEFGNLGKIPAFPQLITSLRSKGCSISIILQDIEQLRMVYGRSGASTIINGGCSSKIFFGGIQNMETLQEVSRVLGTKTLAQKTSDGKELASIARPLKLPDEISKMKMGKALFLSAGEHPVELSMKQFSDTKLKHRVQKDDFGNLLRVNKPNLPDGIVSYFEFDNPPDDVVQKNKY